MELFNTDEKKLLEMISNLRPYDVMKIAIDPWGTYMSVHVSSNFTEKVDFKITRRDSVMGIPTV